MKWIAVYQHVIFRVQVTRYLILKRLHELYCQSNTSKVVYQEQQGSLCQCTGLQRGGDGAQKRYPYTIHPFGVQLLLFSFLIFLSQNHKDPKQNDSSEHFCKYWAPGTFLSWLFLQLLSAGSLGSHGSAHRKPSRLSFPPGWLFWPTYQVGSQPTVDISYHQEVPLNQCLKWFNCSCKQITAKFAVIPKTAMVNQVTQALPLPKMGLCSLNPRKVAAPFWTLAQQTSLA